MNTYHETLEYLNTFTNYEKIGFSEVKNDFNLDKIKEVLKKLDNPHLKYKKIHVAGTKGKGSVCAFTSSVLIEAGYKVGIYTSPHLFDLSERIRIGYECIQEEQFVSIFNEILEALPNNPHEKFTYFEIITLVAILFFSKSKIDYGVFEVGLGGKLDATNVIDAEYCAISKISYDHMNILGDSLEEIANEKIRIVKPGAYCISANQDGKVLEVIENYTKEINVNPIFLGKEIKYKINKTSQEGTFFDVIFCEKEKIEIETQMLGEFQAENAALAVILCREVFREKKINMDEIIKKGIKNTFLPGRMQIISRKPDIIIDGAHNADSMRNLIESIKKIFNNKKIVLIFGIAKDKDIKGVCDEIKGKGFDIILTKVNNPRACDVGIIKGYLKGERTILTNNVKEALGNAFNLAKENDIILSTGSFYLISEMSLLLMKQKAHK